MLQDDRQTAVIDYELTLSRDELLEYGAKMADLDRQRDDLEAEGKASNAGFKARIADVETERRALSACVRSGKKKCTGECEVVYDYDDGTISYKEIESGNIVYSRKMSVEERQLSLFGGK